MRGLAGRAGGLATGEGSAVAVSGNCNVPQLVPAMGVLLFSCPVLTVPPPPVFPELVSGEVGVGATAVGVMAVELLLASIVG